MPDKKKVKEGEEKPKSQKTKGKKPCRVNQPARSGRRKDKKREQHLAEMLRGQVANPNAKLIARACLDQMKKAKRHKIYCPIVLPEPAVKGKKRKSKARAKKRIPLQKAYKQIQEGPKESVIRGIQTTVDGQPITSSGDPGDAPVHSSDDKSGA